MNLKFVAVVLALLGCAPRPWEQEPTRAVSYATPLNEVRWGWSCPAELLGPGTAAIRSACLACPVPGCTFSIVCYPAVRPPHAPGPRPCTSYRLLSRYTNGLDRFDAKLGINEHVRSPTIVLSWRVNPDGSYRLDDIAWEVWHASVGAWNDDTLPLPPGLGPWGLGKE